MTVKKKLIMMVLAICFAAAGTLIQTHTVSAAAISSTKQAEQKALEKVPGATVIDSERDTDDGITVYEVELIKGSKQFKIVYRASNGKMLEYGWEKRSVSAQKNKPMISKSECKKKAKKKVENGTIISIHQERDDGIDIYEVKMSKGSKRYSLVYHARTGDLIEYEWEY